MNAFSWVFDYAYFLEYRALTADDYVADLAYGFIDAVDAGHAAKHAFDRADDA